eukprot:841674-Pyramimonas_sp.AAC.1
MGCGAAVNDDLNLGTMRDDPRNDEEVNHSTCRRTGVCARGAGRKDTDAVERADPLATLQLGWQHLEATRDHERQTCSVDHLPNLSQNRPVARGQSLGVMKVHRDPKEATGCHTSTMQHPSASTRQRGRNALHLGQARGLRHALQKAASCAASTCGRSS